MGVLLRCARRESAQVLYFVGVRGVVVAIGPENALRGAVRGVEEVLPHHVRLHGLVEREEVRRKNLIPPSWSGLQNAPAAAEADFAAKFLPIRQRTKIKTKQQKSQYNYHHFTRRTLESLPDGSVFLAYS